MSGHFRDIKRSDSMSLRGASARAAGIRAQSLRRNSASYESLRENNRSLNWEGLNQLRQDSVRDPIEVQQTGMKPFVVVCALLSSINSLLLGYDCGVMSDCIRHIREEMDLTATQEGLVIGCLSLISAPGALWAGKIADAFGRKWAMGIGGILFLVGAACCCLAPGNHMGFWVLLVGRLITGLGVGIAFVIGPLYTSECAPARYRGVLTSCTEFFIDLGIVLGYLANLYLRDIPYEWRVQIGLGAIPVIPILLSLCIMPESPRWLMTQGRRAEAQKALRMAYPEEEVQGTLEQIADVIELEKASTSQGWHAIFHPTRTLRLMLMAGLGVSIFQQAIGNDAVVYYTPQILEEAGIVEEVPKLQATVLVGLCKAFFVIIPMLAADKLGRRFCLLGGQLVYVGAMVALTMSYYIQEPMIAVIALCVIMGSFSAGIGPMTHVIGTEVFPLMVRGRALSLSLGLNRLLAGTCAFAFPEMKEALGYAGVFQLFTWISLFSVIFIFYFVPETAGKSLEEIQVFFRELAGDDELGGAEFDTENTEPESATSEKDRLLQTSPGP